MARSLEASRIPHGTEHESAAMVLGRTNGFAHGAPASNAARERTTTWTAKFRAGSLMSSAGTASRSLDDISTQVSNASQPEGCSLRDEVASGVERLQRSHRARHRPPNRMQIAHDASTCPMWISYRARGGARRGAHPATRVRVTTHDCSWARGFASDSARLGGEGGYRFGGGSRVDGEVGAQLRRGEEMGEVRGRPGRGVKPGGSPSRPSPPSSTQAGEGTCEGRPTDRWSSAAWRGLFVARTGAASAETSM